MATPPTLALSGVTLYREGRKVLDDLFFTVRPGEHWVLLGPNGSGKSSLMALLQGHLWPQDGEVQVLGRRFGDEDLSELRRQVGWVGGDIETLFPARQTVAEIVVSGAVGTVGLQFDAPRRGETRRTRRLLGELGLSPYRDTPYPRLSQGQKRLVTIGRALMTRPGLLILDEPAAGLDPVSREGFLQRLGALIRGGGPSILYVTHHVEEILPEFTHAALLKAGRLEAAGPLRKTLTSDSLSRVFGRAVRLLRREGRYGLRLDPEG